MNSPRRIAVVGAGAVGGWLADAFLQAGWRVSVVARGATLEALRRDGLCVEHGAVRRVSHPIAGPAAELGEQDYVILTVKAHDLSSLAPQLVPLLGPATAVMSGTNGIPWWFFQNFQGALENQRLTSVDPDGFQSRTFPYDRSVGSVVHASMRVSAPAHVRVMAADRLILGEPNGEISSRVQELVAALRAGGINAQPSQRIREAVWAKLWGNMNMNPISALTRSGTAAILNDADVRELCVRMMEEMQRCGAALDLGGTMTAPERIEVTRRLGNFRTSMLEDVEAGRQLELAPQLGAIVEIAGRLDIPVPHCRSVLGLARLLAMSASRTPEPL